MKDSEINPVSLVDFVPALVSLVSRPTSGLESLREKYGRNVRFRLPGQSVFLVSEPADVHFLLTTKPTSVLKGAPDLHIFRKFFGRVLLGLEGDETWFTRRRLLQPAFHRKVIESASTVITEETQKTLDGWESKAIGGLTAIDDLYLEFSFLTARITSKLLLGTDISAAQFQFLGKFSEEAIDFYSQSVRFGGIPWVFRHIPGTAGSHALSALKNLRSFAEEIYRKEPESDGPSLIPSLKKAHEEDPQEFPYPQVMDEIINIFLAGHETTATALSWGFYEMHNHPEFVEKIAAEAKGFKKEDFENHEKMQELQSVQRFFKEVLRLHPPVWLMSRQAIENIVLPSGGKIPKSSFIALSPYLQHHDPVKWEKPYEFDPDRFSSDPNIPGSYIPFGMGPRSCIGASLALTAAPVIFSKIALGFRVHEMSEMKPAASMSLKPEGKVKAVLNTL